MSQALLAYQRTGLLENAQAVLLSEQNSGPAVILMFWITFGISLPTPIACMLQSLEINGSLLCSEVGVSTQTLVTSPRLH